MSNGGDDAVERIAKRRRHEQKNSQQAPRPYKTAGNSQGRGGPKKHLTIFDEDQRTRALSRHAVSREKGLGRSRLRCAEAEIAGWIPHRDELHRPLTEGARAIKQDDAAGGRGRDGPWRHIRSPLACVSDMEVFDHCAPTVTQIAADRAA